MGADATVCWMGAMVDYSQQATTGEHARKPTVACNRRVPWKKVSGAFL